MTYETRRLKQVKPATFNREIAILRHAFNIARRQWRLPLAINPLVDFKKPKVINERSRRVTNEEYERLRLAALNCKNRHVWPIVRLAFETGMRRGEILSIHQSDVNFSARTLTILKTKTDYPRFAFYYHSASVRIQSRSKLC